MTNIELRYDETTLRTDFPFKNVDILLPEAQISQKSAQELVQKAFLNPLGGTEKDQKTPDFRGKSVVIAINDQTRPLPHHILLPELLAYLHANGAADDQIQFIIATGTHRALNPAEIEQVLPGNLHQKYAFCCHNCDETDDLVYLGDTKAHTPVYVSRFFHQADVKILVGNIEPHHFMGFSGGFKTASIGLTGRKTIEANHAMLPHPLAKMGHFDDNPMRNDVEDIGRMLGVDYALNIVMNDRKEILHALWGDPQAVIRAGIPLALAGSRIAKKEAECRYDLVIASAGGYPKDINLYQAQKAITNACLFSKKGGIIILSAGCRNGAGNSKFIAYARQMGSWQAVLDDFPKKRFEIGPHKAYQLALQARDHKLILVSEIAEDEAARYFVSPARSLDHACALAAPLLPSDSRVAVLPYATHSIPLMEGYS
ncbi:MAG: lactate racemase [Chloroflexota bacterium]|nr:lactate racemase [Chloroflexota bacterium]